MKQHLETGDSGLWLRRARVRVPSVTLLLWACSPVPNICRQQKGTGNHLRPRLPSEAFRPIQGGAYLCPTTTCRVEASTLDWSTRPLADPQDGCYAQSRI